MAATLVNHPFLVAILAGAAAQLIKVITFLILEKRVNYRRFVQADGSPNMHTAALSALSMSIGLRDGFDSMVFVLALCLTVVVCVDTMNVKNAASKQAEVMDLILKRIRRKQSSRLKPPKQGQSYTPVGVFFGVIIGVAFALLVF
jgi:acid phosphatase family membrane protein YuiD